jgi:hypothetical protein
MQKRSWLQIEVLEDRNTPAPFGPGNLPDLGPGIGIARGKVPADTPGPVFQLQTAPIVAAVGNEEHPPAALDNEDAREALCGVFHELPQAALDHSAVFHQIECNDSQQEAPVAIGSRPETLPANGNSEQGIETAIEQFDRIEDSGHVPQARQSSPVFRRT